MAADRCAAMKFWMASWWWTSVSAERWRCQPMATTPTETTMTAASGSQRRTGEAEAALAWQSGRRSDVIGLPY